MPYFIMTRTYEVEAETLEKAQEEVRNHENDLDYLVDEEWEKAK